MTIFYYQQHCAQHRYLSYSNADFEVFRPAGATRCTDGVKFRAEGTPSTVPNFTPSMQQQGYTTPKVKFLLRFDQNVKYKRPAGAYPLRNFHKICRVCTLFQDASAAKISLDMLKGLWSYPRFKLRGSGYSQIFSAPYQ